MAHNDLGIYASQISGHLWAPNGAMDALATVTVSSGTATSITFAGIPQGYKHLKIHSIARESTGTIGQQYIRFNSDAGNNYSIHTLTGNGSSAGTAASAGGSQNKINCGIKAGSSDLANVFGAAVIDILDYASTTKNKTVRTLSGVDTNGAGYAWISSGSWYSTSPVTSIVITAETADFAQYSSFALYGVK